MTAIKRYNSDIAKGYTYTTGLGNKTVYPTLTVDEPVNYWTNVNTAYPQYFFIDKILCMRLV